MPDPSSGRVFGGSRVVRATDVTPAGRLRLDALTRYLQDVAEDDVADTGWQAPYGWLLRRCAVSVRGYPGVGTRLRLRTFCSGTGPRWAERTTTLAGRDGDIIQAAALWVAVDQSTGQPCLLGKDFYRCYGEAAQGRQVSARLELPGPDASQRGRDWPTRVADFDTAGHVNNSVYWAALEDVIQELGWLPVRAELECHRPIMPGSRPRLVSRAIPPSPDSPRHAYAWLAEEGDRFASARLVAK